MEECKHTWVHIRAVEGDRPYDLYLPYNGEQYSFECICQQCGKIFNFDEYFDNYVEIEKI